MKFFFVNFVEGNYGNGIIVINKEKESPGAAREELLEKLFSMQRFGIKPGLDRTAALAEFAGNPQKQFLSIHVAGTNGKGSVSSIIASVLTEAGYKTGLYTSPHLVRFNERIRINGIEIPDSKLIEYTDLLLPETERLGGTFFEITTVLAFKYFTDCGADAVVVETGMGGRLDSTNILRPAISVITNINYDHCEYLGSSLQEIAAEKAGIIKAGIPVVISETRDELRQIFEEKGQSDGSKIFFANEIADGSIIKANPNLTQTCNIISCGNKYENLYFGLAGKRQLANLLTAVTALNKISGLLPFTEGNLRAGLKNIRSNTGLNSRIELLRSEPPLVIDAAHNPDSFDNLLDTLDICGYGDVRWNFIFAAMADKDIGSILKKIYPRVSKLFLTGLKIKRAAGLELLVRIAREVGFTEIVSSASVEDSLSLALLEARPLLIAGSFYLAGEALPFLNRIK